MERRAIRDIIASNVTAAIEAAGTDVRSVAEATDMPLADLESALRSETPIGAAALGRVGGFLRVPVEDLMEGTAA